MTGRRRTLIAVAVVGAAAVAGGLWTHRSNTRAAEAARAEEIQKAAADRQALERRCIGVRYRFSQRQSIDLAGKTADRAFIDAKCEPARL